MNEVFSKRLIRLIFCLFSMLTAVSIVSPDISWAGEQQKIIFGDEATDSDKAFINKVVDLMENSDDRQSYYEGLAQLGLTDQKTILYRYRLIEKENRVIPVLVSKQEFEGCTDSTGDIGIQGGTQADLTLTFHVSRGYEFGTIPYIWVDYYFEWSNCEEIDGTLDGWACNWDTEEAYASGCGCDYDMDIVEQAVGGMGIETDDDNSVGHAWVSLTPRDGSPAETHGELTQTYCHTYGFNSPSVTFSVNLGMVSVSVTPEDKNHYWKEAARSTY